MFFFFFKQKTAYEMRISDWSSDVCSSDLNAPWSSSNARRLRPRCWDGLAWAEVYFESAGASGSTAGPKITPPSVSNREPWHGQSHVFDRPFQVTVQPMCVQVAETVCSTPASSR